GGGAGFPPAPTPVPGSNTVNTVTQQRPARIAGIEQGTAVLAAATSLALTIAVAALTHSLGATVAAGASIVGGLVLVLSILPHKA
ncbi:hypothetical protein, partial [Nocardia brasiliensis]|uniref:hypothetical protein n=1 Tax=Nocardia brasiliensis TaxID=37326 RepID=UPI002454DD46